RVLSDDAALAAEAEQAEPSDPRIWARLASAIDLERWHRPAEGENLSESPVVRRMPGFAPPAACRWLIEKARGRLVPALVYDAFRREEHVSQTRTNTWAPFDLVHSDLVGVLIQARMCASAGLPFRFLEPLTVLHYDVGEQITEHYDFVDPATPNYAAEIAAKGQRKVTFLLYLNDDYEGGETELPRLGIS